MSTLELLRHAELLLKLEADERRKSKVTRITLAFAETRAVEMSREELLMRSFSIKKAKIIADQESKMLWDLQQYDAEKITKALGLQTFAMSDLIERERFYEQAVVLKPVMMESPHIIEENHQVVDEHYHETDDTKVVHENKEYCPEEDTMIINVYNQFAFQRDKQGELIMNSDNQPLTVRSRYKIIVNKLEELSEGKFKRGLNGVKQQIYKLKQRQINGELPKNFPKILFVSSKN